MGIMDVPVGRSSHVVPVPKAGGVAVMLSLVIGTIFLLWKNKGIYFQDILWRPVSASILAIFLIFITGLWDDLKGLSYQLRLVIHLLVGVLIVYAGFQVQFPILKNYIEFYSIIQIIFTILGVQFLINASNFADGLNGFLSGNIILLLLASGLFLDQTTLFPGQFLGDMALLLTASILGFFVFNFPKGKIFLGDVGSTTLGLFLSILFLYGQGSDITQDDVLLPRRFFALISPMTLVWWDIIFTLITRIFRREPIVTAHRDYLFLRLQDRGHSHAFVSIVYYICNILITALTYFWFNGNFSFSILMTVILSICCLFTGYVLNFTKEKDSLN